MHILSKLNLNTVFLIKKQVKIITRGFEKRSVLKLYHLRTFCANNTGIYLLKVNNKTLKRGVKYVQS